MTKQYGVNLISVDKSNLYIHHSDGKLHHFGEEQETSTIIQCQHIYITSDNKVMANDYCIEGNEVIYYNGDYGEETPKYLKKIIATTDLEMISKRSTGDIAKIPMEFVELYIKQFNGNNPIGKVKIQSEEVIIQDAFKRFKDYTSTRVVCNDRGEVIIIDGEMKYTKGEFIDKLYQYWAEVHGEGHANPRMVKWFEERL